MRRRSNSVPALGSRRMMWCFRASPTLNDLDDNGSSCKDAADIPMESMQTVLDFASACIACEGRACMDAVSLQLPVAAVQELRRSISAIQHAMGQKGSPEDIYELDLAWEHSGLSPRINEYLKCHLSGMPERIAEDDKSCSVDSRHESQRNAVSDTQIGPGPLPPLAPHFFHHKTRTEKAHLAEIWPPIKESLQQEVTYYPCGSIDQAGVGQASENVGTMGTSQAYPDLAPVSAMTTDGMTGEIDNMIEASAANALAMTSVSKPPVSAPRTHMTSAVIQILESMVRS